MLKTVKVLHVFVLQLENDKWFLHVSHDENWENIICECISLFDFVKKNPPIRIYEVINITNKYDINNIVKTYMEYFSIDNVRGGIYSDEILPKYLVESLELEINSSLENYEKKIAIFDSIREKENITIKDFQSIQNAYTNLLNSGYIDIKRDFFTELEWLHNIINTFEPTEEKKKSLLNDRYTNLLKKMDTVREKYFQLSENTEKINKSPFLNHPKFIFDFFMYHKNWNRNWETDKINALIVAKQYEMMGYTLINMIDCMEFDFFNPISVTC